MKLTECSTWIVGASSGIGAALATELAERGAKVTISARSADALQQVAGGRMRVLPMDITSKDQVDAAVEQLGDIDTVIIAAGYWQRLPADELDFAEFAKHFEVNINAFGYLVAKILPHLKRLGKGTIVGISSVAGYRGFPGSQAYGATKAAQINLLESMRVGLKSSNIEVITVCPGFVDTPMTKTNEFPMPFQITAQQAAKAIADGLERDKVEIVFPWQMAWLMKLARFVPASIWPRLFKTNAK